MCRERVSEGFRLAGDKILQDGAWEQAKLMYSLSLDMNLCNLNALCNRAHINLEVCFLLCCHMPLLLCFRQGCSPMLKLIVL